MRKFLSALASEDSPVGDLAFDILRDESFARVKITITKIRSRVKEKTSDSGVLDALEELGRRYRNRASFARGDA